MHEIIQPSLSLKTVILLVDDQEIIAEAIKKMIKDDANIELYYCKDPTEAIRMAEEINPTVILQDLVMPEIDGLKLVQYFRANHNTKDVPMIVLSSKEEAITKAQAFSFGANDYIVKLPDKIELLARIRYHSEAYKRLVERNDAYVQLEEKQKIIQDDLDQAAAYMVSLLPEPITGDEMNVSWIYIPSAQLGGDAFGYHWLNNNQFVIYLLDVCGHGVGSALLSITVMNLLYSSSLLVADHGNPTEVLQALNKAFPMETHGGRFFTMWYGVYDKNTRLLKYSSAGHPPALLRLTDGTLKQLKTDGFVVGGLDNEQFETREVKVPKDSNLYVFSDGIFELATPQGKMLTFPDFIEDLNQEKGEVTVESILSRGKKISQTNHFDDDFSIVRVAFQ